MSEKRGILTVFSGPAGSGKGTVVKRVLETRDDFAFSVSATTRAPRPGEVDGVNYHFITREKFLSLIEADAVVEYTEYCGNYYGTLHEEVEKNLSQGKNLILEIEVEGAMNIKKKFPDAVLVLLLPPDYKTLEARLRGRATDSEESILKRLARAREELALFEQYDYFIENPDNGIDAAAQRFISIIESEHSRVCRNKSFPKRFFGEE